MNRDADRTRSDTRNAGYQELKGRIHQELLNRLESRSADAGQARGRRTRDPRR